MIYELAYPRIDGLRLTPCNDRKRTAIRARMNGETVDPDPGPSVARFMVCKEFLHSAIRVHIKNQRYDSFDLLVCTRPYMDSLLQRYVTDIAKVSSVSAPSAIVTYGWRSLKRLALEVDTESFSTDKQPYVWEEVWDEAELKRSEVYRNLEALRGLTELTITGPTDFWNRIKDDRNRVTFEANLAKMRGLLLPQVTKPREETVRPAVSEFPYRLTFSPQSPPGVSAYSSSFPPFPQMLAPRIPRYEPSSTISARESWEMSFVKPEIVSPVYNAWSPQYAPAPRAYGRSFSPFGKQEANSPVNNAWPPHYATKPPGYSQRSLPMSGNVVDQSRDPRIARGALQLAQEGAFASLATLESSQEQFNQVWSPSRSYNPYGPSFPSYAAKTITSVAQTNPSTYDSKEREYKFIPTSSLSYEGPWTRNPDSPLYYPTSPSTHSPQQIIHSDPRSHGPNAPSYPPLASPPPPESHSLHAPLDATYTPHHPPTQSVINTTNENTTNHLTSDLTTRATSPTPSQPFNPAQLSGTQDDAISAFVNDPAGFLSYVKTLQQQITDLQKKKEEENYSDQGRK